MQLLLGKVAFDTMIFQAPFLNLYFAITGALEGLTFSQILEKTRASFHRAWFLSFMVWTPVQLINLAYVPLPLQASVVATVMMGWQTTLSLLNHYHDHGSPRNALHGNQSDQPPASSPQLEPVQSAPSPAGTAASGTSGVGGRSKLQSHLTVYGTAAAHAGDGSNWAAERAQLLVSWEAERSQQRTRLKQLIAENRSLRYQLGQLHATAGWTAPERKPTPRRATENGETEGSGG